MTDYSAAPAAGGAFSVGAVIKRSFSTYFANFVPFTVLALVLYLPTLIYGVLNMAQLESSVPSGDPTGDIIIGLISMVLTYVLMGALVYGTVQHLGGQRPNIGAIVSRGMSTVGSVVLIAIGLSIVVGIGFLLLVVPGIYLSVGLAVVIPVAVVERPGIGKSFDRSWQLTKGYRWPVLGILLVMFVLLFIFSFLAAAVLGFVAVTTDNLAILVVLDYLISAFSGVLFSVAIAVTYHDLRVAKEGVSTAQIAAVFD